MSIFNTAFANSLANSLASTTAAQAEFASSPAIQWDQLLSTIIYAILGIVVFSLSFIIIEKLTPFSIRKEIVEGKNLALGMIMASIVIGLSIIIAAAIL